MCVCVSRWAWHACKNYILKKSLSNFTLCNGIYENAKLVEQLLVGSPGHGEGKAKKGRGAMHCIALGKCEVTKPLSNNERKC